MADSETKSTERHIDSAPQDWDEGGRPRRSSRANVVIFLIVLAIVGGLMTAFLFATNQNYEPPAEPATQLTQPK